VQVFPPENSITISRIYERKIFQARRRPTIGSTPRSASRRWHNVKPKLDQLVPHSEQAKIEATLAKKVPPPPSPAEVEAHDLAYQRRMRKDHGLRKTSPGRYLGGQRGPRASRLDQSSGANRSPATSRPPPARAHNPKCPRCGGRRYRWKPRRPGKRAPAPPAPGTAATPPTLG
jgi:hypothetical protein